jgi:hypothetical protein
MTSSSTDVDGRSPALTGYQYDYVFDWTIMKYQQTQQVGGNRTRTGLTVLLTLTYMGDWSLARVPGFSPHWFWVLR